jgi:hypothetical protein
VSRKDTGLHASTRLIYLELLYISWLNLTESPYEVEFNASKGSYPTAFLRFSVSSIPSESHLQVTLDGTLINYTIPPISQGSKDRAWVQVPLPQGLRPFQSSNGIHTLKVELTEVGRKAEEGQGGKMLTSIEIIEYGEESK